MARPSPASEAARKARRAAVVVSTLLLGHPEQQSRAGRARRRRRLEPAHRGIRIAFEAEPARFDAYRDVAVIGGERVGPQRACGIPHLEERPRQLAEGVKGPGGCQLLAQSALRALILLEPSKPSEQLVGAGIARRDGVLEQCLRLLDPLLADEL